MNTKRGFTLIELLVVIAIIAILASILFPVFAQAKLAAKKAVTLSNIKQSDLGLIMYSGDADDQFPQSEQGDDAKGAPHITWTTTVYPYVKSGDLAVDPANGNTVSTGKSGIFIDDVAPQRPVNDATVDGYSFGVNRLICIDNYASGDWLPLSQQFPSMSTTQVNSPADSVVMAAKGMNYYNGTTSKWNYPWLIDWQTMYIGSIAHTPGDPSTVYRDGDTSWSPSSSVYNPAINTDCDAATSGNWQCAASPIYRYNNHSVFAYVDGHAKALGLGQLQWWHNIYVARGDITKSSWTYGWYYPDEPY